MNIRGYRVFYLDPEEDINSLLAELGQDGALKLALVVDQRSNVLTSRINLQLLQKYLKEWGKELVIVSQEMRLIRLVLETDLKIYPDLDALKEDQPIVDLASPIVTSLPTDELLGVNEGNYRDYEEVVSTSAMTRSLRRRKGRWGRRVIVALFAMVVLAGLVWLYIGFPMITVEVSPSMKKLEQELEVICEYDLEQVLLEEQKIPLLTVNSDVEGQVSIPATGRIKRGFTRAEGTVMFVNNSDKAITVPAGTTMMTGTGIKFKTVQAVTVPKMTIEEVAGMRVGTTAGRAEVKIVALEAGSIGNVLSAQITKFADKQYNLQVSNLEDTQNGTDREESVIAQADLNLAISKLEEELKQSIRTELSKEIGSEYLVLEDTLEYQMVDVQTDHHVDEQAEQITASGKILASGYILLKDDLRVITEELYLSAIPEDHVLYSSGIQISKIKATLQEDQRIMVNLTAVAQVVAQIEPQDVVDQIKGQTVEYADGLLRKMKEIRYFRILADGKSRIPRFTFAIRVLVREPTEPEEGSI